MRKVALVVPFLMLTGCAETYGPAGSFTRLLMGGGYRDRQIDPKTWEIEYSGANFNYDFVRNSAIRRSAEIAKREGFPYFTVVNVGQTNAGNYAGDRYVGGSVFVKVQMRGWRAYEERCNAGKIVKTAFACDLYNTQRALASYGE